MSIQPRPLRPTAPLPSQATRFRLHPRHARPVSFVGQLAKEVGDGTFEIRIYLTQGLKFVAAIVQLDGPEGEEIVKVVVVDSSRPERTFREIGMSPIAQQAYRFMGLDPTIEIE